MLLGGDIVLETLQNYVELKKHLAKAKDFILQNPWSITVPEGISIEEVATIRTDFFVDSYSKIYIQLKKKDPNLTSKSPQLIYYYKLIPGLFKQQMKDGGFLGGRDEKGRLITSADVILEKQAVNVEKFLSFYYSTHN